MTSVNLRRFICKSKYLFSRKENRLIYTILKYHRYITPEDIKSSKIIITRVYKRIDDLKDEDQKQILTKFYDAYYEFKENKWGYFALVRKNKEVKR